MPILNSEIQDNEIVIPRSDGTNKWLYDHAGALKMNDKISYNEKVVSIKVRNAPELNDKMKLLRMIEVTMRGDMLLTLTGATYQNEETELGEGAPYTIPPAVAEEAAMKETSIPPSSVTKVDPGKHPKTSYSAPTVEPPTKVAGKFEIPPKQAAKDSFSAAAEAIRKMRKR